MLVESGSLIVLGLSGCACRLLSRTVRVPATIHNLMLPLPPEQPDPALREGRVTRRMSSSWLLSGTNQTESEK